ncbi:hypothetical protein IG631_17008 [Alternaria alternata]|nr:hypothetical protein IG631_17008 [Alternaria alternata]
MTAESVILKRAARQHREFANLGLFVILISETRRSYIDLAPGLSKTVVASTYPLFDQKIYSTARNQSAIHNMQNHVRCICCKSCETTSPNQAPSDRFAPEYTCIDTSTDVATIATPLTCGAC